MVKRDTDVTDDARGGMVEIPRCSHCRRPAVVLYGSDGWPYCERHAAPLWGNPAVKEAGLVMVWDKDGGPVVWGGSCQVE